MKKIILTIIFTLILSGCNVTYNLELDEAKINDIIEISGKKEKYLEYSNDKIKVDSISDVIYRINDGRTNLVQEKLLNDNKITYKFSGNMEYQETEYMAPFSNWCYEMVSMFSDDSIVTLTTTNQFLCYDMYNELETVEINVTTNYKVLENNADKIEENKYTWYIDKSNKDNKPLIIKIDKSEKEKLNNNTKEDTSIYIKYLLEMSIILILIVLIIKKMHRTNNK